MGFRPPLHIDGRAILVAIWFFISKGLLNFQVSSCFDSRTSQGFENHRLNKCLGLNSGIYLGGDFAISLPPRVPTKQQPAHPSLKIFSNGYIEPDGQIIQNFPTV
jgi:hypothetical protein